MATVRICVCGDEGTGKSSLIVSLVRDTFVTTPIQPVLLTVTLPPSADTPNKVTTIIVDTSARPQDRTTLRREIRKCNVILLVYSGNYSYERVALFWMPYFRSLGVNVPVVLCSNKSDLQPEDLQRQQQAQQAQQQQQYTHIHPAAQLAEDEMLPVMAEFREIDSCIRTSALEHRNINEVFFLCQKAFIHPIAPLFDYKEGELKPACVGALKRIFFLCDQDQDGLLSDAEMSRFQQACFHKPLPPDDLENIKQTIARSMATNIAIGVAASSPPNTTGVANTSATAAGINLAGFLQLNKIYAERGRHETIWVILRKFRYTDSLSLEDKFLHPKFDVPASASAELSPTGYRFFVDLFLLFDKDNDGGLSGDELTALFSPTPGLPELWVESSFPSTTVRNDVGHVTLQGWLALWSMTTFLEPKTTLEYLAYLGFGDRDRRDPTVSALKVTKPRHRRRRLATVDRHVVHCYIVGAPAAGKSALLDALLSQPFDRLYRPTIRPRRAVNNVELPGGKQCYLILEELGELEPAVVENAAKLETCDLICYAYDSSDPDSFSHVVNLRTRHQALLEALPAVLVACKADRDKATQNTEVQPDAYAANRGLTAPLHVSVAWESISELFVALAEAATNPSLGYPRVDEPAPDRTGLYVGLTALTAAAAAAAVIIYRRSTT